MTAVWLKIVDLLLTLFQKLRRIRVQAHRGVLLGIDEPCLFINATNLSSTRDVEVTHVWLETDPRIHVLNPERPLPKRLKPDEPWETWLPLASIPERYRESAVHLGRVHLSSGKTLRTVYRRRVPEAGWVPGG